VRRATHGVWSRLLTRCSAEGAPDPFGYTQAPNPVVPEGRVHAVSRWATGPPPGDLPVAPTPRVRGLEPPPDAVFSGGGS